MKQVLGISAIGVLLLAASAQAQTSPTLQPADIICEVSGDCGGGEVIEGPEKGDEAPFSLTGNSRTPPRPPVVRTTVAANTAPTVRRSAPKPRPARRQGLDLQITFVIGSDQMTPQGEANAKVVAQVLVSPRLANIPVRIQGHTDSIGDADYNLELSRKRALAVVAYLVAAGVPSENLTAEGYGLQRPLPKLPTTSPANRRVEIVRADRAD